MKKVLVRAPLLTSSGYGVHSRQVFSWLLAESKKLNFQLDVECLKWGMCSWLIDKDKENGLVGEIMSRSKPLEKEYDVTFQIQLPDEWKPELGKYNVGITAAVETDKCNPKWVDACNKMDEVVVPSTFTKNVLKRSGILKTDIKVIPEWYNTEIDKSNDRLSLSLSTKFNFLMVGMLTGGTKETDRKNIVATLEYLCEKFKDNKDVGIVIKTSMGKNSSFDKKRTKEYFNQLVKLCRKGRSYPKINLLYGDMTKKEMSELHKSDDLHCYVSLTRAEGYGLPIIDAAACGMPIIATNYSGHLEFLKGQKFLPVDYKLINIDKTRIDNRIFMENTRWAEPDKNSFFTKLDELYNNYNLHKQNAVETQEYIQNNFNEDSIIEVYNNQFGELLNDDA